MKAHGLKKVLKGFTIIELLIAIIIIGILVAVIIPRLATRSELARIRATESDLEEIRKAEEHSGIDTGYYYRLYVLDDNPGGDNIDVASWDANENVITDRIDGVRDEEINTNVNQPRRMFISPSTGELYALPSALSIFEKFKKNETSFGWNGRYITWQKDLYGFESDAQGDIIPNDIPDDPWSHDYLFFTKEGLVLEPDGVIVEGCNIDAEGNLVAGAEYNCKVFDRFALLSLGPDGLPGSGPNTDFGTGDDIVQQW